VGGTIIEAVVEAMAILAVGFWAGMINVVVGSGTLARAASMTSQSLRSSSVSSHAVTDTYCGGEYQVPGG
jgi:hypothetical protein